MGLLDFLVIDRAILSDEKSGMKKKRGQYQYQKESQKHISVFPDICLD